MLLVVVKHGDVEVFHKSPENCVFQTTLGTPCGRGAFNNLLHQVTVLDIHLVRHGRHTATTKQAT